MTPPTDTEKAPNIDIPAALRPADGRFGSGPSKVRPEQLARLAGDGASCLAHRTARRPCAASSAACAQACASFRASDRLPGGARQRWRQRLLGDRGVRAGQRARAASRQRRVLEQVRRRDPPRPVPRRSHRRRSRAGQRAAVVGSPQADVLAWAHNETSTGVMIDVRRPADAGDALVVVDGTSGAGGLPLDPLEVDAYYFAPQKCFGSDGGLWLALLSPAALSAPSRSPPPDATSRPSSH